MRRLRVLLSSALLNPRRPRDCTFLLHQAHCHHIRHIPAQRALNNCGLSKFWNLNLIEHLPKTTFILSSVFFQNPSFTKETSE
ncbi:hypothetical protein AV530_000620 [Patagioenas fasciata monilis]|uniref:Uncharacterized protein n=1 Tax=Patagioenas fasciata monilis TaxID=372326 RepID=A0A1V4IG02_PATFA|nr:hypothetical protein AV530_000620 [Patagioenas fasciata monilis]